MKKRFLFGCEREPTFRWVNMRTEEDLDPENIANPGNHLLIQKDLSHFPGRVLSQSLEKLS